MRLDWARMLLLATAMAFMQVGINHSCVSSSVTTIKPQSVLK